MLVVNAKLKVSEGVIINEHIPMNDVKIVSLPPKEEDETKIFEEIESMYPEYIPVSIDSITWSEDP